MEAHGIHDGKYYSAGRAGEAIGESMRSSRRSETGFGAGTSRPATGKGSAGTTLPAAEIVGALLPVQAMLDVFGVASPSFDDEDFDVVAGTVLGARAESRANAMVRLTGDSAVAPSRLARNVDEPLAVLSRLEEAFLRRAMLDYSAGYFADLVKRWAETKAEVANTLARARVEVVATLTKAPQAVVPDPLLIAEALLGDAFSTALEQEYLRRALCDYSPSYFCDLVSKWAQTKADEARILAQARVDVANRLAPLAPSTVRKETFALPAQRTTDLPAEPAVRASATEAASGRATPTESKSDVPRNGRSSRDPKGGRSAEYLGEIVEIIPSWGAKVALPGGETGYLHISKLRQLNGGAWVDNLEDVVRLGQKLHLKAIGTDKSGRVSLAPVSRRANPEETEVLAATHQDGRPSTPCTGCGPDESRPRRWLRKLLDRIKG